jgi:hypothetical protein
MAIDEEENYVEDIREEEDHSSERERKVVVGGGECGGQKVEEHPFWDRSKQKRGEWGRRQLSCLKREVPPFQWIRRVKPGHSCSGPGFSLQST